MRAKSLLEVMLSSRWTAVKQDGAVQSVCRGEVSAVWSSQRERGLASACAQGVASGHRLRNCVTGIAGAIRVAYPHVGGAAKVLR